MNDRVPDDGTRATPAPPLRFDILTLFPGMFAGPLGESILRRAQDDGRIEIGIHDIRQWTTDRHRTADDTPYGGGAGMVMRVQPIVEGVESLPGRPSRRVLLMSAGGRPFDQSLARELSGANQIVLICGHYEGIDERVTEILGAEPVSVGDYVLTGGELPAMIIVDAVSRLVEGVIDQASIAQESFEGGLVEYPHYTRPAVFRDLSVPEVLLSGNHGRIESWRREQAIRRTADRRPDLLQDLIEAGGLPPAEDRLARDLLATPLAERATIRMETIKVRRTHRKQEVARSDAESCPTDHGPPTMG
jgi:tRNA (guanine37-N1)-methyltransferase